MSQRRRSGASSIDERSNEIALELLASLGDDGPALTTFPNYAVDDGDYSRDTRRPNEEIPRRRQKAHANKR